MVYGTDAWARWSKGLTLGHGSRRGRLIVSEAGSPPWWERKRIPTKVILDGLKRNMSRGDSLSDELELSSVLGDTRAYLYSPLLG